MGTPHLSANQLTVWAALFIGLLVAVALGSAVGTSDMRFVAGALAMVPLVVVLINLKTHIWVLIPIGWYLSGRLPFLPLPFTVRDLCILVVLFAFTLFFALRIVPWKRKVGTLDYLILINLAYLATVYFRNPVGALAFRSELVGGRPYFEIVLAFGAFLVLSRITLTPLIARIFPLFFLIPAGIVAVLDLVARFMPQFAYPIAMIYTGAGSMASGLLEEAAKLGETRITGLKDLGASGMLAICARYNPITLLSPLHPLRALLFLCVLTAIFASGFRGLLLFAMFVFVVAALLRQRLTDLWIAAALGVVGILLLVSLQGSVLQLPRTMQRTLSWLPGDWNEEAVESAEGSSQWRFEMWGWAWNDERIMRDKMWGQGFGFTLDDLNIMASALMSGEQGGGFIGGSDREAFMITGTFHSGPLSTIKFIGFVGLSLYFPLMLYMALLAWRLCRRAHGTPIFPLALFIGIPIIYEPFNFVVIFGALEGSYPQLLFWAGLLNMTNNHLDTLTKPRAAVSAARAPAQAAPVLA